MKFRNATLGILGLVMGCAPDGRSAPDLGSTIATLSSQNILAFNALAFNALAFDNLASGPIATQRRDGNRLLLSRVSGLETTTEGRQLLRYIAQCALVPGDILVTEHDDVEYQFPGLLAAAPQWEMGPLSDDRERLLSACLLAHVNAYGVSVPISVRSPGFITAGDVEIQTHPVYEGTFFGNLYGDTSELYACTGSLPDIARAQSDDRTLRVCTDPIPVCQIPVVGRCRDVCDTYTDKYGWQDCWADGNLYPETVSTFLSAHGTSVQCAPGSRCEATIEYDDAVLDCNHATSCDMSCIDSSYCTMDGNISGDVYALVWWSSQAEVHCNDTGQCSALCMDDSSCEIDCHGASSCTDVHCMGSSSCLIDCTGSDSCGFAYCEGVQTSCPGGIVVCNQPCPS